MRLYKLISSILFMIIVIGLTLNGASFDETKLGKNNSVDSGVYATRLQEKIDNDVNLTKDLDASNYDIVKVAYKEIGNIGGEKYWRYLGFNSYQSWCACFVSWCANECGFIEKGIIPKFSSVGYGYSWFVSKGLWLSGSYAPEPGMIVFFDFTDRELNEVRDGVTDHVGIVKDVKDGYVYCIEGNYRNTCQETKYVIGHYNILGYGTPEY